MAGPGSLNLEGVEDVGPGVKGEESTSGTAVDVPS